MCAWNVLQIDNADQNHWPYCHYCLLLVVKFIYPLKLKVLSFILGQEFDSAAMQQLSTAIKIRTHRNFRRTVSADDRVHLLMGNFNT